MKLQEVFDQLTSGELSQLSIGGEGAGVINEDNWTKVINHINLGLTALYKRFLLKEGTLKLELHDDITTYILHSRFAVNVRRSSEEIRYIIDTVDSKFTDDIFKVERVITDNEHEFELRLNDRSNKYSVFTPTMTSLVVPSDICTGAADLPDELKTDHLMIKYRANHKPIVVGLGYFDPVQYELELPPSHLEALLLFVASRVHNPIGMSNEFHAGNSYWAKYERACQELELQNITVDQGSQNDRLHSKGWV